MTVWRFRQRDTLSHQWYNAYTRTKWSAPWMLVSPGRGQFKSLGEAQYCYDVKSTGYKPGRFLTNPCCMSRVRSKGSQDDLVYQSRVEGNPGLPHRRLSGNWFGGNFPSEAVQSSNLMIENSAVQKVLYRALGSINEPPADFGMILAELGQTASMLLNPLKGLASLLNKLHREVRSGGVFTLSRGLADFARKKHRPVRPSADLIADKWLEYQFGILPLIGDVNDIRRVFDRQAREIRQCLDRKAASISLEDTADMQRQGPWTESTGWFNLYTTMWRLNQTRVTAHCYWYRKYPYFPTGGSVYDIPNLVWELIPFSFVVDWIVDIGGWLRSIQPNESVTYVGNCVTFKSISSKTYQLTGGYERSTGWPITVSNAAFSTTAETLIRECGKPIPVTPVIQRRIATLTRALDSASLIWQKLPRRF